MNATVPDYRAMLEQDYADWCQIADSSPVSRLVYASEYVFDFTTYDDAKSEVFASKALEVCQALNDGTTLDFIKDESQYHWYLIMINMPFFTNRLNWGTSIRGAWWDTVSHKTTHNTTNLRIGSNNLTFTAEQWKAFIACLLAFAKAQ